MIEDDLSSLSVILLDDEEDICRLFLDIAINWGIKSCVATPDVNIFQAAMFDQFFDVAFVDVVLPNNIDGLDLIQTLRDKYPLTEFIAVSGRSDLEARIEVGNLLVSFMKKPLNLEQVKSKLLAIVARKKVL